MTCSSSFSAAVGACTTLVFTSTIALAQAGEPATGETAEGPRFSAAAALGHVMPADALDYGFGFGLKGTVEFGLLHAGAGFLVHSGDEVNIEYGPVPALGVDGGTQTYSSTPVFLLLDAGLALKIAVGERTTLLAPFLTTGLALMNMSTSGPYGDDSTAGSEFALGWGVHYRVPISGPWGLGIEYRMLPLGDGEFDFGESSNEVEHGFSTSLFYHALFLESSYRF